MKAEDPISVMQEAQAAQRIRRCPCGVVLERGQSYYCSLPCRFKYPRFGGDQ